LIKKCNPLSNKLKTQSKYQVKAQEKADLMLQLLGYPDYVVDGALLDEFYSGVKQILTLIEYWL